MQKPIKNIRYCIATAILAVSSLLSNMSASDNQTRKSASIDPLKGTTEKPIDIKIDEPKNELSITFYKSMNVRALIAGPEGVVYYGEINATRFSSFCVDLGNREGGNYDISLYNNNGCVTDETVYISETYH